MGRREQPVDPSGGPLQSFAHDLQVLRRQAGEPPYRAMARRVGVSYTALSQAAKGERLPTLATTLAFVRACGGDDSEERRWRQRWEQILTELVAGSTVEQEEETGSGLTAPSGPSQLPSSGITIRSGPSRTGRRIAKVVGTAAVLGSTLVVGMFIGARVITTNVTQAASRPVIHPIVDGQDPYIGGCGHDQQPLERQPIYFKDGKSYGWVVLFYSHACGGAWAYVLGPNSRSWRVYVAANRVDDNKMAISSFQGNSAPNSWGNALSTRTGCVRAEAWVGNGPHAVTSCWRPGGPLQTGA